MIGRNFSNIIVKILLLCIASANGKSKVVVLDEDSWTSMLEGEWMVEFFAPWCPACKAVQPIWEEFATWGDDLGIKVAQVDVTACPGLSGRFMVTALPTIFHVKDAVFRLYRGSRGKDAFMSFIEEQKWKELDEVPVWRYPASYQMTIVAQFFKLSMVLRGFHSVLVDDYGLPTWGSYLIFALATIVVGALLGLILVCIIDFLFPPTPIAPKVLKSTSGKSSDEEDLLEDRNGSEDGEVECQASERESEAEESHGEEGEAEEERVLEDEGGSKENSEPEATASQGSSPNVRKRQRARKAD